jgi:hypothetical protein
MSLLHPIQRDRQRPSERVEEKEKEKDKEKATRCVRGRALERDVPNSLSSRRNPLAM